ncbi:MAG: hypothetical protein J7494_11665 [Sphingobium sp.]|nr:hypothetical protein [Sphingobium sp.]
MARRPARSTTSRARSRAPASRTSPAFGPDGYSFNVRQTGVALSYQEYANGVRVGQGAGGINGRDLRYSFETGEDRGECTGRLSADGSQISGRCKSVDGNAWPFAVTRQN